MKMASAHAIALTLSLLVSLGCQSTMEVKVERIEPLAQFHSSASTTGGKRIPGASYSDAVATALVALQDYPKAFAGLEDAMGAELYKESVPNETALIDASQPLLDRGESLLETGENVSEMDARRYVLEVRQFLIEQRTMLRQFAGGFQDNKRIEAAVDSGVSVLDGRIVAVSEAAMKEAGFGGFHGKGVYVIDPADPAYKAVLNGTVSGQPITLVKGDVTGESALIFVQESPTQMRPYNVDLDATALVKNVAGIMDKALAAWANYMTTGAPVAP